MFSEKLRSALEMLSAHELYFVTLLTLAEARSYDELKHKVQDELGKVFRGILKVEERHIFDDHSKKEKAVLPAKAIQGGVYVMCYRDQDEGSSLESPLDLSDLPEGKWKLLSGQQAGRKKVRGTTTDKAQSKRSVLRKFRYVLKRDGGRGMSAHVYQLADAYYGDKRGTLRCRLVDVFLSLQHSHSKKKSASPRKRKQIPTPDPQQPLQNELSASHAPASSMPTVHKVLATSPSAQDEPTSKTTLEPSPPASAQRILTQDEAKTSSPVLVRSDSSNSDSDSLVLSQTGLDEHELAEYVGYLDWTEDELCDEYEEHEIQVGPASKRQRNDDVEPSDVVRGEEAATVSAELPNPKIRILILHFRPADTKAIDFEREMQEIKNAMKICERVDQSKSSTDIKFSLRGAKFKECGLELLQNVSLRMLCIAFQKSLKEGTIYNYIHFSGHGFKHPSQTLAFAPMNDTSIEDVKSKKLLATNQGLADIIRKYKHHIKERHGETLKGVLLNCCHGIEQGEALREYGNVPSVIAHNGPLSDKVAIHFAGALWAGIASGSSMKLAFKFAKTELDAAGLKDHHYELLERSDNSMTAKPLEKTRQESSLAPVQLRFLADLGGAVDKDTTSAGWAENFEEHKLACHRDDSYLYFPGDAGNSAVAFSLMHEFAKEARSSKRKILYLAPSVSRMFEQYYAFRQFAVASAPATTESYCHSLSRVAVDICAETQIIFLTGGLFYYLLRHPDAPFSVIDFSLIVFDETYHPEDNLDFSRIMKCLPEQRSRIMKMSAFATASLRDSVESDKVNLPDTCYYLYVSEVLPAARPFDRHHLPEETPESKLDLTCFEDQYLQKIVLQFLNQKVLRYIGDSDAVAAQELRGALGTKIKQSPTTQNRDEPTMSSWICTLMACEEIKQRSQACSCVLQHVISLIKCFSYYPDIGSLAARKEAVQACFVHFVHENFMRDSPHSSLTLQENLFNAFLRGAADDELECLIRFTLNLESKILDEDENLSVLRKVCLRKPTIERNYTQIMHELNQTKLDLQLHSAIIEESKTGGARALYTYVIKSKTTCMRVGDPGTGWTKKAAIEEAAKSAICQLLHKESLFLHLCKAAKTGMSTE